MSTAELFTIDVHPLTSADYARARAEALAENHDAVMALTRRQVADVMAEWVELCHHRGHDRPEPFSLPGKWTIIDVVNLGGGLEVDPPLIVIPAKKLGACENHVIAQLYVALWAAFGGDLDAVGEAMLGEPGQAHKIRLRMNRLGIRLRELKAAEVGQ